MVVSGANRQPTERRPRSRFRAIAAHVIWSAAIVPLAAKWLVFVVLAGVRPPVLPAAIVWVIAFAAAHVWATRRSLTKIRRRLLIDQPQRCLIPCVIGFAAFLFFSFLLDIAAANNNATRPGGLIAVSMLAHFAVFAWMSWTTQETLLELPEADRHASRIVGRLLVPAGDFVLISALITLIVLLNS